MSDRTIEWQNASADTNAVTTPSASDRTSSSRCSSRIVVAPSRRLQNAQKSCSPNNKPSGSVHRANVQRTRPGKSVQPPQRMRAKVSIRNPVLVVPPQRGEPSVKRPGHHPSSKHPNIGGQRPSQPLRAAQRHPQQTGRSAWATCPEACTPASVRPATVSDTSSRNTIDSVSSRTPQTVRPRRLPSPAGELGAVVPQVEAHTNKPAAPGTGSDGLVSGRTGQDSSF